MERATLSSLCLLLLLAASPAAAWDESVDGDLSSDPATPTPIAFSVGSNIIDGSVSAGQGDTRDYLTFTLAPGETLVAINQLSYVDIPGPGPGNRGYHSLNTGTTSLVPTGGNSSSFLGGDHLDAELPGTDMLPTLASAPLAGTGFIVPLHEGSFSYLVQQTGPQESGYSLEFVVDGSAAVPSLSPSSVAVLSGLLMLIGGAALYGARRRQQRDA